ncbi:S1C family serine protease [Reinekea sp.]|jgi:S1-C subfamily serine protease|uniref:S1C family serine protease n=1 Tax=Reinekea sp. TaxID=1970455 RepID=UPI003988C87D
MQIFNNHKEWIYSATIGLVIAAVLIGFNVLPANESSSKGYSSSLDKVRPYVVSIYSKTSNSNAGNPLLNDPLISKYISNQQQTSLGSGILLGQEGLVVTNAHVIDRASSIIIQTHDGQRAPALYYWVDPDSDIALIKTAIEITPTLPLSSMEEVKVGDFAFTIGNPFGVGQSVSMGIISATGRLRPNLTNLTDFIQTDAAINPGNSGGALVNSFGQVIGMNSAIVSSTGGTQGIGFAIPIQYVIARAMQLKQQPFNVNGFIGIDVIEVLEQSVVAIQIVSVLPNSSADLAGLKVNDEIIAINGQPFTNRQDIIQYIQRLPAETIVTFNVKRNNELLSYPVVIQTKQP